MTKLKIGPQICLLLMILSTGLAKASLISVNDSVLGLDKITRDTSTQLEWLDIDLTAGLSWNEAVDNYTSLGFSHASVSQVESLFSSAGILGVDTGTSAANYAPSLALQDLITCRPGFNSSTASSLCSTFAFTALDSLGRSELAWVDRNNTLGVATVIANSNNFIGPSSLDSYRHISRSHWMVRSTEVPEPSALLLTIFGLLALFSSKRLKVTS
jgi:hypothetical protein